MGCTGEVFLGTTYNRWRPQLPKASIPAGHAHGCSSRLCPVSCLRVKAQRQEQRSLAAESAGYSCLLLWPALSTWSLGFTLRPPQASFPWCEGGGLCLTVPCQLEHSCLSPQIDHMRIFCVSLHIGRWEVISLHKNMNNSGKHLKKWTHNCLEMEMEVNILAALVTEK